MVGTVQLSSLAAVDRSVAMVTGWSRGRSKITKEQSNTERDVTFGIIILRRRPAKEVNIYSPFLCDDTVKGVNLWQVLYTLEDKRISLVDCKQTTQLG